MAKVKVNGNGLAPVFLKREFGGNVGGDVAGYPEKTAQSLVDQGFAEPYNPNIHDQVSPNFVKSQDARLEEIRNRQIMQSSIAEFRPAEIIHEDEANRVAALAEVSSTERFIPSTTTTRQEIKDSGALVERIALTTADIGITPAAASGAKSASSDEPPVPPSSAKSK